MPCPLLSTNPNPTQPTTQLRFCLLQEAFPDHSLPQNLRSTLAKLLFFFQVCLSHCSNCSTSYTKIAVMLFYFHSVSHKVKCSQTHCRYLLVNGQHIPERTEKL